jgi:hypothetical protein
MSDLGPQSAKLLQLLQDADDQEAGIAVIELPEVLRDSNLLAACEGQGLIEFIRRNHCHVGGRVNAKLVLESGWNVAQLAKPNRKRVKGLLAEALTEQVEPEIRYRLRLTYKGDGEAARLALTSAGNGTPPPAAKPSEGEKPKPIANRTARDPNQPGRDRQNDILAAIRAAGMPLTRPELIDAMKFKTEGKLGANLAWMVTNGILMNILQRGYWPANEPVPE